MQSKEAEILTTIEVARQLTLSPDRVRQLARAGKLPALRTASGIRLFNGSMVEAFRRSREEQRLRSHR